MTKSFLTMTQKLEAIKEKINKVDYKIFSKLSMAKKLKSKIKNEENIWNLYHEQRVNIPKIEKS